MNWLFNIYLSYSAYTIEISVDMHKLDRFSLKTFYHIRSKYQIIIDMSFITLLNTGIFKDTQSSKYTKCFKIKYLTHQILKLLKDLKKMCNSSKIKKFLLIYNSKWILKYIMIYQITP